MKQEQDGISLFADLITFYEAVKSATSGVIDYDPEAPAFLQSSKWERNYAAIVKHFNLDLPDRLLFVTSIIPLVKADYFDNLKYLQEKAQDKIENNFGAKISPGSSHYIPTLQTFYTIAAHAVSGIDMTGLISKYVPEREIFGLDLVKLFAPVDDIFTNSLILPSSKAVSWLDNGLVKHYIFSHEFPAKKIDSKLAWDDLVLARETKTHLEDIVTWLKHSDVFSDTQKTNGRYKPGYRTLFYGPPGTGKTFSASLIGKRTGKEVYKIDLSMVVSKYIGETEKNLSKVFDAAESNNWILFFDEADALFGKRTAVNDSHDRYANQEVSYLLQRIEDCPCLVIIASNFRKNIDAAFLRRFQSVVNFPMPNVELREQLWRSILPAGAVSDEQVDIPGLSKKFDLAGGSIINIVQYAYIQALKRNSHCILQEDLLDGARKEYLKEGKMM